MVIMDKERKNKILIVDDEPANILFLEGFLTEEGFETITASNGNECLELMKDNKPDTVLLDIMMPEMSGIEVLKTIINDETLKGIPVIMVTAKSSPEDTKEALSIGAIEYIKKPVDETELLARLNVVLRIKKQEEKLKELVDSKDAFIRIISHDLRTPFTSISGFAQMLYEDEELTRTLSSEHKEFLEHIIKATQFSVNYFNKLLDWTKLGASDLKLILKPTDIAKVLKASVTIFMSKINEKNIKVNTDINSYIANIDETFFLQAINNIISNAIKFTPREGEISISNTTEDSSGSALIKIEDTGGGIEMSADELFNKTYHKSKRGTEGEKGTGVGLHICKKILEAHDSDIWFESEAGTGTTFYVKCTPG